MRSGLFEPIVIGAGNSAGIVSFVSKDSVGTSKPNDSDKSERHPWYPFGENNLLPEELNRLIWDNSSKPELIRMVASFIVGKGIYPYVDELVDNEIIHKMVDDLRWKAFKKRHKIDKALMLCAKNLATFNNIAVEIITNGTRDRIETMQVIDFNKVRAERIGKSGRIENYYVCADWKTAKYDPDNEAAGTVVKVPAWNPDKPKATSKFIVHLKDHTVGNDYYGYPSWFGTRNWLRLSNQIALWHLAGMANGYNIRWHCEIPESYFDQFDTDEKKETAKQDLQTQMTNWLSGVDNVGKSFVSFFKVNEMGQKIDGWKVTPITFDLHDEAFTKLYEQSEASVSSGGGIDPQLAGVSFPNKMGAGSGSEKRLAYQIHTLLKTTLDRQVICELLEVFELVEGWPAEWEWAFLDYDLTTLDQLKSGMQPVVTTQ
jgi:hypothetical protein